MKSAMHIHYLYMMLVVSAVGSVLNSVRFYVFLSICFLSN